MPMANLLNLSNAFLKSIDNNLKTIYLQYVRDNSRYKELIARLQHIRSQIDEGRISARIDYLISRIKRQPRTEKRIVEVVKDDKVIGILCDNIEKPYIGFVRDETPISCSHAIGADDIVYSFNKEQLPEIFIKEDISDFDDLKGPLFISLYTHDYRSFAGFTCLILVSSLNKAVVVDTLTVRNLKHKIFHCGTVKFFHCKRCVDYFKREFGDIGCYSSLEKTTDVYVDWRIRPLSKVMVGILNDDLSKMINGFKATTEPRSTNDALKYNYTLFTDEKLEIADLTYTFMEFYRIEKLNYDVAYNILKLRNFIARSNNESPWYVLTDRQVVQLVVKKPETSEAFQRVLLRISALAREHIFDFVLIIKNMRRDEREVVPVAHLFEPENAVENCESDEVSEFSVTGGDENK